MDDYLFPLIRMRLALSAFAVAVLLSACSTVPSDRSAPGVNLAYSETTGQRREIPAAIRHVLDRPDDLWGRIAWDVEWRVDDALIAEERAKLLGEANFFELLSTRAVPALPYIVAEIERLKLPMELALVPIIESMLDPWAYSSQRAAGLWQITPATAAYYGLEVNWWYDARLDIPVATEFALNYLLELQQQFDGDWSLALAAYNAGRGRVARAQQRAQQAGGNIDFWALALPQETRRYVPKLLALADILRHADRYNITLPLLTTQPAMTTVRTFGQIEMQRAAELAGLEPGEVRRLNPAQIRWATAPEGSDSLWLPSAHAARFEQALATITLTDRVMWAHYTIAPGDSLSAIAQRFDSQVAVIRSVNALESSLIRAGDTLMIPRAEHWQGDAQPVSTPWPPPRRSGHYRVKEGDSLWTIAQRHGLKVAELTRLNQLDPAGYLRPGQRLRVTR